MRQQWIHQQFAIKFTHFIIIIQLAINESQYNKISLAQIDQSRAKQNKNK